MLYEIQNSNFKINEIIVEYNILFLGRKRDENEVPIRISTFLYLIAADVSYTKCAQTHTVYTAI